jgi:hypothetical protein
VTAPPRPTRTPGPTAVPRSGPLEDAPR